MTSPSLAAPRPRARPFLPSVPTAQFAVLTSGSAKALLIGALALAYVLQFGLSVLTAVIIFFIRQDGELEEQTSGSVEYLLTLWTGTAWTEHTAPVP